MAVIINELEVVVESTATPPGAPAGAPPQPASNPPLQSLDLLNVAERKARTEWRVLAH